MQRIKQYSKVSISLACLSNEKLKQILADSKPMHEGIVGKSALISIDNTPVFVKKGMQKDKLPLTLIVTNLETDLPVAVGSLWIKDGTEWPEKTPWIASIYTLYRYRGLGLAKHIVKRLEAEAINIGFPKVYLQSGSAADFYRNLGYEEIETIKKNVTASGTETLFIKKFNTRE